MTSLFAFSNDGNAAEAHKGDDAVISKAQLKHLLQGVAVDSKLNDKDFAAFLALVDFDEAGGGDTTTVGAVKSLLFDGATATA